MEDETGCAGIYFQSLLIPLETQPPFLHAKATARESAAMNTIRKGPASA